MTNTSQIEATFAFFNNTPKRGHLFRRYHLVLDLHPGPIDAYGECYIDAR